MMARAHWTATTSLTTMVTTRRVTIDDYYKDGATGDNHDDDGDGAMGNDNDKDDDEDHDDRGGEDMAIQ